jgi:hypothetical protein
MNAVIVGTAVITHVTPRNGGTGPFAYEWHLYDAQAPGAEAQRQAAAGVVQAVLKQLIEVAAHSGTQRLRGG